MAMVMLKPDGGGAKAVLYSQLVRMMGAVKKDKHLYNVTLPWMLMVWCTFTDKEKEQFLSIFSKKVEA